MGRQSRALKKHIRRAWRRHKGGIIIAAAALVFVAGVAIERSTVEANYSELLSTIAEGESRGNYNAYFGHAGNTKKVFTDMTVDEVLKWQQDYVASGSPSSAVGKYQFIQPTLQGLVDELGIDRQARFDAELQDRLAIHLLKRRGVDQYMSGRISREEFAHNLSKEWAALPRVIGGDPEQSYYAGDGLNHVQVSVDEVLAAIETLHHTENS